MVWCRWNTLLGLGFLGLVSCSQPKPQFLDSIEQIKQGVVRISYGDMPGQGTGFLIEGKSGVCTVVTAAHVVKPSELILVSTYDLIITAIPRVYPAHVVYEGLDNLDLAVVVFDTPGEGCPYASLRLGDSEQIKPPDKLYLLGFPHYRGEAVLHSVQIDEAQVSQIGERDPQGYDIIYMSNSAIGSGSPLVNKKGKVIGVHGRKKESGFRLAIPITKLQGDLGAMLEQLPKMTEEKSQALFEQGTILLDDKKWMEALGLFEQVIEIEPEYAYAWIYRGYVLEKLGEDEQALQSFEKAIDLNPVHATFLNQKDPLFKNPIITPKSLLYLAFISSTISFATFFIKNKGILLFGNKVVDNPKITKAHFKDNLLPNNLRDPRERVASADFENLYTQLLDNVKILLKGGMNREAFAAAFNKIIEENPEITWDSIQSIDKKGKDVLLTLKVPLETDKAQVEQTFDAAYVARLKAQAEAQAIRAQDMKDIALALAQQQNAMTTHVVNQTSQEFNGPTYGVVGEVQGDQVINSTEPQNNTPNSSYPPSKPAT